MPKVIEDAHWLTLTFPIKELKFKGATTLSRILKAAKKHFPTVPQTQLQISLCVNVITVRPSLEFACRNIQPLDKNGKRVRIGNQKKQ